ncbi:tyrosine-type recombinase/integrase [Komagataeibacter intermedius]|uniref:Integrase n=3 Tax=Komagataeibacter intermedius TaxID=66229 RepID=A0A0N1N4X4_9PROT|nr:tyrosine-type recombinase/integrase [Komagataeibacter intermedius]KPH85215.1 integrase [Komagataeibacter intermedius AF2]MCF3638033.1 tyrosine-type recombinase/integrase [Komagataeibacter intermedius]GBQ76941.1 phage DNA recombinase [Komagataeibacter intermedius NRIC 0521]
MLSDVRILGSKRQAQAALHAHVDPLTRQRLAKTQDMERWRESLSTARFTPPLPLLLAGIERPDGTYSPDTPLAQGVPYAAAAQQMAQDHIGDAPSGFELAVGLEIDDGTPRFLAWFRPLQSVGSCPETSDAAPPAPVGQPAATVAQWFSVVSAQPVPEHDGRLATARQAADAYMHRSKAGNTLRTYRAAVRSWCQWAAGHALPALPARGEDVAAYLADMALQGRRTSTIDLHRAALRYLHHLAQIAVPTSHPMVTATLAGIRREAKEALPRQKTALTWDRLVRVVDTISPHDLVGARDRAILLLGFAGAFRRSELAALKVDDITVDEDGMQIRLGRSKGDPQRKGALIGIPRGLTRNCPVLAYEAWLRQAGITEGPVFRRIWSARGHRAGATPVGVLPRIGPHALSDRAVTDIIRKRCGDTHLEGDFGGHSLRRGAITTGAKDGYDLLELKRFSRHKSLQVVETYIDEATIKARHPGRSRF